MTKYSIIKNPVIEEIDASSAAYAASKFVKKYELTEGTIMVIPTTVIKNFKVPLLESKESIQAM